MYNHYYFNTQSFTHSVQETRETREKTRTRIFRAGSGQVWIQNFSGFSYHALEKPESSGRGGFRIFSGFCTLLYRVFISRKCVIKGNGKRPVFTPENITQLLLPKSMNINPMVSSLSVLNFQSCPIKHVTYFKLRRKWMKDNWHNDLKMTTSTILSEINVILCIFNAANEDLDTIQNQTK